MSEKKKQKPGKYKPLGGNGFGPESADNPCRRPLPELRRTPEHDPEWQIWTKNPPARIAGYYWVCGYRMWPKIVEYKYVCGKLRAVSEHDPGTWTKFAGPIPDPVAPMSLFQNGSNDRQKHVEFL